MTLANQITFLRILLIPVFAVFFLEAGRAQAAGLDPAEWHRAATLVFILCASTDMLDGWVARTFHQQSRLGAILDPLADKGLALTTLALLTLGPSPEPWRLPVWFTVLVVSRDIFLVLGYFMLRHFAGEVEIKPNFLGKTGTALLLAAFALALLRPAWAAPHFPILLALTGTACVGSFALYARDALQRLSRASS